MFIILLQKSKKCKRKIKISQFFNHRSKKMLKMISIFITLLTLFGLIAISETEILAYDAFIKNSPIFPQKTLSSDVILEKALPCNEPFEYYESKLKDIKGHMKDEEKTLAFITKNGTINISLYEYLTGVVLSEIPYTFEEDAIMAQVIAARTYATRELGLGTRHSTGVLCDNPSHCSAYITEEEYVNRYGENAYIKAYEAVKSAVEKTDGLIITYNGEPCCAAYHSSSDGYTENSYNLWGTETPYLKSVKSPETAVSSTASISMKKNEFFLVKLWRCRKRT